MCSTDRSNRMSTGRTRRGAIQGEGKFTVAGRWWSVMLLWWICEFDSCCFFFQAEDGIRDLTVTGVQTCALPILNVQQRGRLQVLNALWKPRRIIAEANSIGQPLLERTGTRATACRRIHHDQSQRSEERRVGKECRSRWSPYH